VTQKWQNVLLDHPSVLLGCSQNNFKLFSDSRAAGNQTQNLEPAFVVFGGPVFGGGLPTRFPVDHERPDGSGTSPWGDALND